jgi:CTP:molybdopterin cytidylyltransferase MocA
MPRAPELAGGTAARTVDQTGPAVLADVVERRDRPVVEPGDHDRLAELFPHRVVTCRRHVGGGEGGIPGLQQDVLDLALVAAGVAVGLRVQQRGCQGVLLLGCGHGGVALG